jgi:hypothetical protein
MTRYIERRGRTTVIIMAVMFVVWLAWELWSLGHGAGVW